jgi:hypothetical protein
MPDGQNELVAQRQTQQLGEAQYSQAQGHGRRDAAAAIGHDAVGRGKGGGREHGGHDHVSEYAGGAKLAGAVQAEGRRKRVGAELEQRQQQQGGQL